MAHQAAVGSIVFRHPTELLETGCTCGYKTYISWPQHLQRFAKICQANGGKVWKYSLLTFCWNWHAEELIILLWNTQSSPPLANLRAYDHTHDTMLSHGGRRWFVHCIERSFQDNNDTADIATHGANIDGTLCVIFLEFIKFTSTIANLPTNRVNVRALFGMNFKIYLLFLKSFTYSLQNIHVQSLNPQ